MDGLRKLPLERITPSRVWSELDPETRLLAARAVFEGERVDRDARREANRAIATSLNFRATAVGRLPASKRTEFLARSVSPDDSLASTLLMALHLEQRRPLLESFLDALEIPHDGGLIDDGHELSAPDSRAANAGVSRLRESFPESEVEVYLASLLALDPEVWSCLLPHLQRAC